MEHLGGDDNLFAAGEIPKSPPDDLLARAVRVGVGSVKEIDAEFECSFDKGAAAFLIQSPGMGASVGHPVGHAAEKEPGYFQAATAKFEIVHKFRSFDMSVEVLTVASRVVR